MTLKRTGNIRRVHENRRYHDRRDDTDERRQPPSENVVRKILVTGDRDWDDITTVVEVLKRYPPETVLIHGACRGADIICAAVAEALGFVVRGYPADWDGLGKAAGPVRNQQMLTLENTVVEPIDVVLVFHDNIASSRGTADMVKRSEKEGLMVVINTSHKE